MPKYEPLNPQDHGRLRLRPREGTDPHFVQIVAGEFGVAAASSPVVFTKHPEKGHFYAGALFNFKPGETALKNRQERGGFEPLALQREGFYTMDERIVIDREHPRFSESDGEPLFDDSGEPSVQLRHIQQMLGRLHTGLKATDEFISTLLDLKLIEPIDVSLKFDDGENLQLQGLYTVSLDRLHALEDADTLRLFRKGYLHLIYIMSQSLQQIAVLAALRNKRLAGGI
jgi:hypothetical protein